MIPIAIKCGSCVLPQAKWPNQANLWSMAHCVSFLPRWTQCGPHKPISSTQKNRRSYGNTHIVPTLFFYLNPIPWWCQKILSTPPIYIFTPLPLNRYRVRPPMICGCTMRLQDMVDYFSDKIRSCLQVDVIVIYRPYLNSVSQQN